MDFKTFYNEHSLYKERRNKDSVQFKEHQIEVEFKVNNLLKVIPEDLQINNILEIGCANGILINNLSERLNIKNVYGIDISDENINAAKSLFPAIKFFAGTFEDFIKNEKKKLFDLIVLSDVIEHIPDDFQFLLNASKHAKYLLINLPLEKSFINRNRNYGIQDTSGHLRSYDYNDALNLLAKAKVQVVNSSKIISIKDSKEYFRIYKTKQKERLDKKPFYKKVLLSIIYLISDNILIRFHAIYSMIYGHNLFCFGTTRLASNN